MYTIGMGLAKQKELHLYWNWNSLIVSRFFSIHNFFAGWLSLVKYRQKSRPVCVKLKL